MGYDVQFSKLELMRSGVESIPDNWDFVHINKVFKICNNLRLPISKDERLKTPGLYPYYGPTKIQGYIANYQQDGDYVLIGEDGDHFLKYKSLPMTQLVSGKCTVNNHAHVIQGTKRATREWFYYYFMHRDIFSFLTRQGAGRYKLNKSALEKLPILVPPLYEQQIITKILSAWDKSIEILEALIAAKQKLKKALMQQLLTGKKRFGEHITSLEVQKTKYGSLPAEWKYLHIGDVAKQISIKNNRTLDLPVLSCTKHNGLVDSLAYFGKRIYSEDTSTYKIVPKNAFAYATNHIEEGSIGYQSLYDEALISPMYTVFQTKNNINDEFLYRLLKTELYRHIFEANTSASVDRRGSLRWNEFSQLKIPIPSLPEQQKIADIFSVSDKEITTHQTQLAALKQQKKALMQQLLTGKKRVKVNQAAA